MKRAPTLIASTSSSAPIVFTRLQNDQPTRERSGPAPPEEAFAFHILLSPLSSWKIWIDGKCRRAEAAVPGDTFLVDLSANPIGSLDVPFDTLRFYISQITIDELARDRGLRRVGGLHAQTFGGQDPILHGLARSLLSGMDQPDEASAMFTEYVALAFHVHVIRAYGGISVSENCARGGLAPWQVHRAVAFLDANLSGNPSLTQLARDCRLSCSHFAHAFRESMGMPPHRWLTKRRIERAKEMLGRRDLVGLAEIAVVCGFVDQSHFTRAFSSSEGLTPGRWRRLRSDSPVAASRSDRMANDSEVKIARSFCNPPGAQAVR